MNGNQPNTRSVFIAALELNTPEERAAYLNEACKDNPELRQRVEMLLRAHEQADDFLEADEPEYDDIMEGPGTIIGHYKLLEEIGEGGFGVVFMADQIEPIRRRVALKVVKPGMDTRQVIARFEAERQALALMDHPNIARVFDAGATESGRPYFVMELVQGIPITQYCDDNALSSNERLKLFISVCAAVQHAHQKGIIHRDLKPSNILVSLHDGNPVPKVIDFGTAKALQQSLTEKTMFTAYGKLIGTPQYMSPEQAEMSGFDVDTRADIYSLGVLLYELLTGTTPFEEEQLRVAAFDEMMRMIREEDPPKPSTRVSSLGERCTDIARHRHVNPDRLQRSLRGDLDWIVMKALEKERRRRYETANDLYTDVQRHLDHEPVWAGQPSLAYRSQKFIRRHRTASLVIAVISVSLLAGVIVSSVGFLRATREAERATSEAERASREAEHARQQKTNAEATLGFLVDDLLLRSIPQTKRSPVKEEQLTLSTALRQAASIVKFHFEDQPQVRARIHLILARMYYDQCWRYGRDIDMENALLHAEEAVRLFSDQVTPGSMEYLKAVGTVASLCGNQADKIEFSYRQALEQSERSLGSEHPDVAIYLVQLAKVVDWVNAKDTTQSSKTPGEAERLFERAISILEKAVAAENPYAAVCLNNLSGSYWCPNWQYLEGKYGELVPVYESALTLADNKLGPNHPDAYLLRHKLGRIYEKLNRIDDADMCYKRLLNIKVITNGSEHSQWVSNDGFPGLFYRNQNRFDEAEAFYKHSVAIREKTLGGRHPAVADSLGYLGGYYKRQHRFAEAEACYKRALEIREESLGPEHPHVTGSLNALAILYEDQGRYDEAEPYRKRLLEIKERTLWPEHSDVIRARKRLIYVYRNQKKYDEAEQLLLNRFERIDDKYHTAEHDAENCVYSLVSLYGEQGRYEEAELLLEQLLERQEKLYGPEAIQLFGIWNELAGIQFKEGRVAEAVSLYEQVLNIVLEMLNNPDRPGPSVTYGTDAMAGLAEIYIEKKQYEKAEPLLEDAQALLDSPSCQRFYQLERIRNLELYAKLYLAQNRYAEAEAILKRLLDIGGKMHGPDHPDVAESLENLATLYRAAERDAEALDLEENAKRIRAKNMRN